MTQPLDKNWEPIGSAWLRALEKMVPKPEQSPVTPAATESKEKAA